MRGALTHGRSATVGGRTALGGERTFGRDLLPRIVVFSLPTFKYPAVPREQETMNDVFEDMTKSRTFTLDV